MNVQPIDLNETVVGCWCSQGCVNDGELRLYPNGRICRICASERHTVHPLKDMTTLFLKNSGRLPRTSTITAVEGPA